MQDDLKLKRPGLSILELGAGCGWLGMTLAQNLTSASVCVTEMEHGGALEHLEHNVRLNRTRHPMENLRVAACDWSLWLDSTSDCESDVQEGFVAAPNVDKQTSKSDLSSQKWDLIVGSDLVYNEIGIKMLPKVWSNTFRTDRHGSVGSHPDPRPGCRGAVRRGNGLLLLPHQAPVRGWAGVVVQQRRFWCSAASRELTAHRAL